MGKRANPKIVGAFILGAIGLIIAAIVLFGSGKWFTESRSYVLFFSGNVSGLRVGAPVKFKGVTVGSVTKILLSLTPPPPGSAAQAIARIRIPVIIEIDQQRIISHNGYGGIINNPKMMKELIREGLRAQLSMESIVTGLLYVDLDMHPGTPATLITKQKNPKLLEIPTLPNALEQAQTFGTQLMTKLNKLDFTAIINSLTETVDTINSLVNSPQTKALVVSLGRTSDNLNATAVSLRAASDNLNSQIGPMAASLRRTSDNASATLAQAGRTLASIQATLAPGSPLDYQMVHTLQDVSDAARSIRQLSDLLQRNPSALIRGRSAGSGQ
ncbi:MAG: MlaD family protein [Candidatus Binataceae bacterium]